MALRMALAPISPERLKRPSRRSSLLRKCLSSSIARGLIISGKSAWVHRAFYRLLANRFGPETPWHFMNYGFDSEAFRKHPLNLAPEDEIDRLFIQLYDYLLSSLPIAGTTVLEVGCGRGGGAAYVARYLRARRMVGIDLCHRSVRTCMTNHHAQNVAFLTGDAQRLPFRDSSFDVVINVESSHGYASMAAFLEEVHRVLRPGGCFVFADLRWDMSDRQSTPSRGVTVLQQQLVNCGLVVIHEADLSSGVLQSRTADNERQRESIRQLVRPSLRAAFAELAGLPGTTMYQHLEARNLVYWSSVLRKPLGVT